MSRFMFVLALAGCADELPSGSILDHDRVLGARVEVSGDPTRASPMPGEEITVRWIVDGPEEPAAVEWMLGACAGNAVGCVAEPFAVEHGSDVPSLVVTAPDADVIWVGGEIGGQKVMASVPIGTGNHNPSLARATLSIGGAPWPETGCAQLSTAAELALTIDAAEREPGDAPLQISHFTTAGALARQFSVLDGGATTIRVDWTPPESGDATRARFVIVLRDGRGGLDTLTRDACL